MNKLSTLLIVTSLYGCSSSEPIGPKSEALLLAEQTSLMQPQTVLWQTTESPLRDYSVDDIHEIEKAFADKSPGDVSLVIGTLSVLTGNLTGVIDVAGGAAGNIATANHPAAYSHWLIAMPSEQAENGLRAKNLAQETIQHHAITLLAEYGVDLEKVVVKPESSASLTGAKIYQETEYRIKGTDISYGFYEREFYAHNEKYGLVEGHTSLISAENQYVSSHDTKLSGVYGFNHQYLIKNKIAPFDRPDGLDIFLKELTSRLPQGYMFYQSPKFSKTLIPAIYTDGKKHEFLKPDAAALVEVKKSQVLATTSN
ncbi:hypothetical protein [Vibrio sp. 10N]|uniref:hypothetical protein n=1 Tax=Vibrio sp. 10N TaxID=3058938 RepID=UPI002813F26D|nr:hypothetical protein VB10N_11270 [Vibrio sp. 10N]